MFIYVRPMYVLKSCNIITCVDRSEVSVILSKISGDARIQGKEEKGTDIDSLQKTISI
jgi:hypothetical protein